MHLLLFSSQSGLGDIGFWGELGWFLGRDVSEFLMEAGRKCGNGCVTVLTRTQSWLTQTRGDRNMAPRRLTHTSPSLTGVPSLPAQTCSLWASLHLPLPSWSRECSGISICRLNLCCFTLSSRIWSRNEQQLSLLWSQFQSVFVIGRTSHWRQTQRKVLLLRDLKLRRPS